VSVFEWVPGDNKLLISDGKVTVADQNETITGQWTFSNGIHEDLPINQTAASHALDVNGEIGHDYVSGSLGAGYVIDPDATGGAFMELDNLRVRNELRAHVFKKDIVKASNGYLLITDSAEIAETKTISGSADDTLRIKDGNGNATFDSGDLLWVKSISDDGFTIYGVKMTVAGINTSGTSNGTSYTEYVVSADGTNESGGNVVAGDTVVKVGASSGANGYLYNDASSANSPFLDVYDGVTGWGEFTSSDKLKVRLGNLAGAPNLSNGTSPSGYGLYSENVFLEGEIVAQSGKFTDQFTVGDNVFLQDASVAPNGEDEIRVSASGGSGTTDYTRIFSHPTENSFGIQGQSGGNTTFFLGFVNGSPAHKISSFNFTPNYLTDGNVYIGQNLENKDNAGNFLLGNYLGNPTIKATGSGGSGTDYMFMSPNTGTMFEVRAGGDLVMRVQDNGTAFVDNLEVRSNANVQGDAVVDGTLTASKIASNTITANEIAADSITANEISVNKLAAIQTQTGNINVDDTATVGGGSGSRIEIDGAAADPKQRYYSGNDLVAVFTSETSPNYSPTKTDDVYDTSPNSSGDTTYSVSGNGIWLSISVDVTNQNSTSSEIVKVGVEDQNGTVLETVQKSIAASSSTTLSMLIDVEDVTSITVTRLNSSQSMDLIDFEIYLPLTVVSRRGVRVYKTPYSFSSLL